MSAADKPIAPVRDVDAVYESKSGDTAAVRALVEACDKIGGKS